MLSDNLKEFIDSEDKRLKNKYPDGGKEKHILARTVKLAEEFGELCEEVLAFNSLQRQEKLDRRDNENLNDEFADVVITTLLLAKIMDIDMDKALEDKMGKIIKRHKD